MLDNILKMTDSYKVSHHVQYPPGTTRIYSYCESRGGRWDEVTSFGLQYFLKRYLQGQVVTAEKILAAEKFWFSHFGKTVFPRDKWEYILSKHNGYLPIRIKAVLEGTTVPTHNVLFTIENTDDNCFWLTNFLETIIMQTWNTTTVCTYSRNMKQLISKYLRRTGGIEGLLFKLHDFGYRGVSSPETAALSGAAHLVNFLGTDTAAALELLAEHYGEEMAGYSIPAAEHSTITSWGRENEVEAYRNMLNQYPDGLVAVVSDSYNIYDACEKMWGGTLRDMVMNRQGCCVIRPDSGDPPVVICKMLNILGKQFGFTINEQGFKVLDDHVRIIQGDGVDFQMVDNILWRMQKSGWSAANLAFGCGGNLLQNHNRDEQKFAIKCSYALVNGNEVEVYKDPVDDPGKKSKRGKLALVKRDNVFQTIGENELEKNEINYLVDIFVNGNLIIDQKLSEIRKRAE